MFKLLIIVDKFKGSLSAREVCDIISAAFHKIHPQLEMELLPLADGGDGTIEAIEHFGDEIIELFVKDAVGREIKVPVLRVGDCIFCEMAKSTGLWSLSRQERDPIATSSYGFGEVIKKVAEMGYRKITLGIGGSATNDVGTGMLSALGFRFLDSNHLPVVPSGFITGRELSSIKYIDDTLLPQHIRELNIEVACDVNNPLTGIYGASHVYGPQKGATPQIVEFLERGVLSFASVAKEWSGLELSNMPGAGAAGGVGYALALFLNAKLLSGWRLLFDLLSIDTYIESSNLIITGEGRVDGQSLSGKLLDGVLTRASHYKKEVWVFCGDNRLTKNELENAGIEKLFSISDIEPIKKLAIANGKKYLQQISEYAATFLDPTSSNRQTL